MRSLVDHSRSELFGEVFDDYPSNTIFTQTEARRNEDTAPPSAEQKVTEPPQINLDELRKEAFEAGLYQGRSEKIESENQKTQISLDKIAEKIDLALRKNDEIHEIFIKQIYNISTKITEAILPELIEKYGLKELPCFLDALSPVIQSDCRIEISANSDTCNAIRQRIGNRSTTNVSWQITNSSRNGDVRFSWDGGSAERNSEALLSMLRTLLEPIAKI